MAGTCQLYSHQDLRAVLGRLDHTCNAADYSQVCRHVVVTTNLLPDLLLGVSTSTVHVKPLEKSFIVLNRGCQWEVLPK